jgi:hypothetical protein
VRAECENLYLFIDGQLDEAAADRFREHLVACRRCPTALENALVLDAIAEQGLIGGQQLGRTIEVPVVAVPGLTLRTARPGRWVGLPALVALAALLLAAVLAAGWWWLLRRPQPAPIDGPDAQARLGWPRFSPVGSSSESKAPSSRRTSSSRGTGGGAAAVARASRRRDLKKMISSARPRPM